MSKRKVTVFGCDYCHKETDDVVTRTASGPDEYSTLEAEACDRCWAKMTRAITEGARVKKKPGRRPSA